MGSEGLSRAGSKTKHNGNEQNSFEGYIGDIWL